MKVTRFSGLSAATEAAAAGLLGSAQAAGATVHPTPSASATQGAWVAQGRATPVTANAHHSQQTAPAPRGLVATILLFLLSSLAAAAFFVIPVVRRPPPPR